MQVYHKWTCDSETVDTFCMEVYGCTVDDGIGTPGSTLQLLDQDGCAVDKTLLDNVDYSAPNGDLMGGQETHVFKYADRPQLYFNCQIRIGVKEPGSDCQVWREAGSGPCPDPFASLGKRKRRSAVSSRKARSNPNQIGFLDIRPAQPLFVADEELTQGDISTPFRLPSKPLSAAAAETPSSGSVPLLIGLVVLLGVIAIALSLAMFLRR